MFRRFIAAAVLALTTFACTREAEPPPATETQPTTPVVTGLEAELSPQQEAGKGMFETVCWTCHGVAGRGDGPSVVSGVVTGVPNFQTPEYAKLTVTDLRDRFSTAMEGPDPEHPHMRYVIQFVRPERFLEGLAYIPVLTYPADMPGSAMAGLALYTTRCTGCHGEKGDGKGYAAQYLEIAKPADFTADTLIAARDFQGLFNRIKEGGLAVHGSAMPQWGVALDDNQIWDLVAYVSTFQPGVLPPLPAGQ